MRLYVLVFGLFLYLKKDLLFCKNKKYKIIVDMLWIL